MFRALINAAGIVVVGLLILAVTVYLAAAGFPFRKYGGRAWGIAKDAGDELAQIAQRARAAENDPDNASAPPAGIPPTPAEDVHPAGPPDSTAVSPPADSPGSALSEPVEPAGQSGSPATGAAPAPVEQPPADVVPPPAKVAPEPPEGDAGDTGAVVHEVQPGDTLFGISKKYYGTGSRWKVIAAANGIENPGTGLRAGRRIAIPPVAEPRSVH